MTVQAAVHDAPDIDLTDGNFYASHRAREYYRWMRRHTPVFRDRNGLAALTTHAAVLDAERQPELFSNAGGMRPDYPPMPFMIDMDDPAHLVRRKLVNKAFTRKGVHARVPAIAAICDQLIDAVCERGHCDFVRDLAAPLPMAVIGDMLGVRPDDYDMLLRWSDDLMTLGSHLTSDETQAILETFASFATFCTSAIASRRHTPGDDLISALVQAEVDGQRLDDDEIVMETLLILLGGDETTRHTLSGGIAELSRHPNQWERLSRDLTLLPDAIEEMLRWTSPAKNMCRTLRSDIDFHGVPLRANEKVMLLYESANFDEIVFGDPEVFRIDRNPNHHLAFGFGPHFCLGNQLARAELAAMVTRVTQRLPDLRLRDDAELPLRPSNNVTGILEMPVVFTATRPLRRPDGSERPPD